MANFCLWLDTAEFIEVENVMNKAGAEMLQVYSHAN